MLVESKKTYGRAIRVEFARTKTINKYIRHELTLLIVSLCVKIKRRYKQPKKTKTISFASRFPYLAKVVKHWEQSTRIAN